MAVTLKCAKNCHDKIGRLLDKYHGGMPTGFLAAIACHESSCNMGSSGDASLGEIGIFQVTNSFPRKVSVNPTVRHSTEGNIFLGCLEYNYWAAQVVLDFPNLVSNGSVDQWLLARLIFAIGYGGTRSVMRAANPRPGNVYNQLIAWANRTGGISAGSQSAAKVKARILAVPVQWEIGQQIAPTLFLTGPKKPIGFVPFTLPGPIADVMLKSSLFDPKILIAGLAATIAWFFI